MKHFKFFVFQSILFSVFFVFNFYFNEYISPPFTGVDLIATCMFVLLAILVWKPIDRFYTHFSDIRFRVKVLLSIPSFILASLLGGITLSLLTGEAMLML
ncbi:hypothetical protein A8F95_21250 [Bacillus wudalianchiensis]|uniref:Uncharacterized protein n=1 Tax=Pseudobacillus wudalianchiensis TaxID=1743143 RepID=A0A1B9B2H0_9BACI|nr:hypothetical protein A8F95_21250 [Bacillus wudalianchiensis]